jgi:hypothetical protein
MKNRNDIGYFSLVIIILFYAAFISCKSTKPATDTKDVSYLYNPTKNPINPRYFIYNQSDEASVLSVKFFASDLFFSEANSEGVPMAMLRVNVKLHNISQGKILVDTATLNLNIVKEKGKLDYIYEISLNVEKGNEYIAEIKILDKLRLLVIHAFVPFNTLSYYNKYNFTAQSYFDKERVFNPVLRINEYVSLVYKR